MKSVWIWDMFSKESQQDFLIDWIRDGVRKVSIWNDSNIIGLYNRKGIGALYKDGKSAAGNEMGVILKLRCFLNK